MKPNCVRVTLSNRALPSTSSIPAAIVCLSNRTSGRIFISKRERKYPRGRRTCFHRYICLPMNLKRRFYIDHDILMVYCQEIRHGCAKTWLMDPTGHNDWFSILCLCGTRRISFQRSVKRSRSSLCFQFVACYDCTLSDCGLCRVLYSTIMKCMSRDRIEDPQYKFHIYLHTSIAFLSHPKRGTIINDFN